MKAILGVAAALLIASTAWAGGHSGSGSSSSGTGEHAVGGYVRSNGTYVAPHMQTNPNTTQTDNWSTKGNTNPYTGAPGTKPATH